jgi:hypothetical protein
VFEKLLELGIGSRSESTYIPLFLLIFVFATEGTKIIGLGIATKIIRNGKMQRVKALKIYSIVMVTLNVVNAVLVFILSENEWATWLIWV